MASKPNLQAVTVVVTASATPTIVYDGAALHRGSPTPSLSSGTQIPQGPQRWPI